MVSRERASFSFRNQAEANFLRPSPLSGSMNCTSQPNVNGGKRQVWQVTPRSSFRVPASILPRL